MTALRLFAMVALLLAFVSPGRADEKAQRLCLSKEQQRAAIAGGQAVRLAVAIRAARGQVGGDVVNARLCHAAKGLVYLLTVLARDGKVSRLTVDAASGHMVGGR
jgi:uncharacterized membrane protein YkoI